MNPAPNRRRFAGLLASLLFLLSVGQAAEGPAAGTVELPRCFGSHMVIPETKDEDAWFLWGWRAKAGGDVEIRFPGLATKPLRPDVRYYSYTNHPGWQLWHLDWGKLPAAVTQSGGRPFSIAITARAGKSTREILLTNVVLGQLVAVGVPPGPLAGPAGRPLGSGIRLLRAGNLAWENLSPREAGAVFAQSWFPGSDLGPDAPERNAGVLYLLAELERAATRPLGVILYPHPTGVDAINVTTGKRLLTESRIEPDLPLLGPACKAAKAAAEADYRIALAAFRERMAALRRDAEVLPVPPRPPAPAPHRLESGKWQRLRLDGAAW
jgi:hypothetical protein